MSLHEIVQALVDGLSVGASYALLALAFSILWATVRTVNLALLQTVAVGGLIAFAAASAGPLVAFLAGIGAALAVGVGSYYLAVQSTIKKGLLYPIIASLGVGLLLQGGMSLTAGENLRVMPELLPAGEVHAAGIFTTWTSVVVFAITIVFLLIAAAVARFTRLGLAFRASAWQPQLAAAYGVDVRSVRLLSAAVAGAATGLAGICAAVLSGSVSPDLGVTTGLNGLVAMLIGGAGNPLGAVLGGLLVGILQSLGGLVVSNSMQSVISLGLLFLIMICKPSGLMRER